MCFSMLAQVPDGRFRPADKNCVSSSLFHVVSFNIFKNHSYPSHVLLTERFAATGCTSLFPYSFDTHRLSPGLQCHTPVPSKLFCGFILRSRGDPLPCRPPHAAQVTRSQHPATAHSIPSPKPAGSTLQVSHCQSSQHTAISVLPGPGTPWEAEKQSKGCLKPSTDTALRRPSLTCRVSLAHSLSLLHARYPSLPSTLNSSPISISLCFCKPIQLFSTPLLPMLLATSYYPCFCPDCWTHTFLLLLAPFSLISLMAALYTAPLHPFFHLRNLYQLLTPTECNSCNLLGFPVLSNALNYLHALSKHLPTKRVTHFFPARWAWLHCHRKVAIGKATSPQLVPCCSPAHPRTLSCPWLYYQVKI